LLATSAAARTGALWARSLTGRRCAAGARPWSAWPRSESGSCSKSGPRAGSCGASGTSKSARTGARGMFGARAACIRAGRGWSAREALSRTCWSACRPAIENRFSTLQSGPCRGSRWRNYGRLINRSRPRLRHHHAARYRHYDFRCLCSRLSGDSGNPTWYSGCGSFSIGRRSGLRRRGCRSFSSRRNSISRWLHSDLFFACSRSRWRLYSHASRRRRHNNNRARGYCPCGSFGDNCACGRTRSNGWSGRWSSNDRSCRARLRNNLAWFRPGGRCSSRCCSNRRCGGRLGGLGSLGRRGDRRLHRDAHMARIFFLFLLLGQQRLHHIAGFGDVRKIDLGHYGFRALAARRRPRVRGALRFPGKVRTNLLSFVKLQRAGVRLARRNPDSWKNVENRPRLYFQLFREIVNTNLTHPPLFNACCQQAVSRS